MFDLILQFGHSLNVLGGAEKRWSAISNLWSGRYYLTSITVLSALIKISLLEGRVMTNASALPVQRQVLEQLFITDPKVGFGQAALL